MTTNGSESQLDSPMTVEKEAEKQNGQSQWDKDKLKMPHMLSNTEFYVYEVEFKRSTELFEKSATCPEDFEVGDHVKVEGGRGQTIGVICNIEVQSSNDVPFFGPDGQENFKKIIGRASDQEKKNLMTKIRDEARALHICNELAARRRLPILIVDAEFQFDRNKLTFSYVSDRRVDFRELVRDLFSLFKTRIWMQKLDCKGNLIHSTMSSKDPTMPALDTPQFYQQQMLLQKQGKPNSMDGTQERLVPPPGYPMVSALDITQLTGEDEDLPSGLRLSAHSSNSDDMDGGRRMSGEKNLQDLLDGDLAALAGTGGPTRYSPPQSTLETDLSEYVPSHRNVYLSERDVRHPQRTPPSRGFPPSDQGGHYPRQRAAPAPRFGNPVERYDHYGGGDYRYGGDEYDPVSSVTGRLSRMDMEQQPQPRPYIHDSTPYQQHAVHEAWQGHKYQRPSRGPAHAQYPQSSGYYPPRTQHRSAHGHPLGKNTTRQVHVPPAYAAAGYDYSGGNEHHLGQYASGPRGYVPNLSAPAWEPSGNRSHGASKQLDLNYYGSADTSDLYTSQLGPEF